MSRVTDIITELDRWLGLQVLAHDQQEPWTLNDRNELRRELRRYIDGLDQVRPVTDAAAHAQEPEQPQISKRYVVVHLLDQSGQPYGSERRCCNRCGIMIWPEQQARLGTPMPVYVDNEADYNAAPYNCSKMKP